MATGQLTEAQVLRQDAVDNWCQALIEALAGRPVQWNIELIGRVRDAVQGVIVEELGLMTEMEFYPSVRECFLKEAFRLAGRDSCTCS